MFRRVLFLGLFFIPQFVFAISFSGFQNPMETWTGISNPLGGSYLTYKGHLGEDYPHSPGENVYSIADGKVIRVFKWPLCDEYEIIDGRKQKIKNSHGWGGVVIVEYNILDIEDKYFNSDNAFISLPTKENPNIIYALYGHLTNIVVSEGDPISKNDNIGEISQMCIYKPHLHFELKDFDAIQNDILNGVGHGYSGTDGYAPHRYIPSKFIEQNKDFVFDDEPTPTPNLATTQPTTPSFFQKVRSYFGNLFSDDVENGVVLSEKIQNTTDIVAETSPVPDVTKEEQKEHEKAPDKITKQIYNAQILTPKIASEVLPGENISITLRAKNTGTASWQQKYVSLNVVGGKTKNALFKHDSWITDLRPTKLTEVTTASGDTGTFTFTIHAPENVGTYTLQLLIVHQSGVQFASVGKDSATIDIQVVAEKSVVIPDDPLPPAPTVKDLAKFVWDTIQKGVKGIKDVQDTTQENIDNVVKKISNLYFGSGGGGDTTDITTTTTPTEDSTTTSTTSTSTTISSDFSISIITPTTVSSIVSTATTTVYGEKGSAVSDIFVNDDHTTVTNDSTTTWHYDADLHEGDNSFSFFTYDDTHAVTSTIDITITRDSTAPAVPTISLVPDTSATPTLFIQWESDTVDVMYDVDIHTNDDDWTALLHDTTSTSYILPAEMYTTYTVRVRAHDAFDIYSAWSDDYSVFTDWSKDVVINEVMWAGKGDGKSLCGSGEWIELYNTTDDTISLDEWSLAITDSESDVTIPLAGTLTPHGYYLIENGDQSIQKISADAVFPTHTHVSDVGAHIILFNQGGTITDELDQHDGWRAGSNAGGVLQSMMRMDVTRAGILEDNWHTSDAIQYATNVYCGTSVKGTPRQDNMHGWYLPSNMIHAYPFENNEFTLTREHSPYIFGTDVDIPMGYTLRIDPGVVLRGVDGTAGFTIKGTLVGEGTSELPITITSLSDTRDEWSCDSTIFQGLCHETPRAGDWQTIWIQQSGVLSLTNTHIYYAGNPFYYRSNCKGCQVSEAVRNDGGSVTLSDATISHAYRSTTGNIQDAFIYSSGGTLALTHSEFTYGCRALDIHDNTDVSLSGNQFAYFDQSCPYPVVLHDSIPTVWEHTTFENNIHNAFYFDPLNVTSDMTLGADRPVIFSDVSIPREYTVTLQAGAHIMFMPYALMRVSGTLSAEGTVGDHVSISAVDSASGFGGIYMNGGTFTATYTDIDGGGTFTNKSTYPFSAIEPSVLWLNNGGHLSLAHTTLKNARRPGSFIYAEDATCQIDTSDIGWYDRYDKLSSWYDNGIFLRRSALNLDNVIFRNIDFAVTSVESSHVSYINMTEDNFIDMYDITPYKNWEPADVFSFDTIVTTTPDTIVTSTLDMTTSTDAEN